MNTRAGWVKRTGQGMAALLLILVLGGVRTARVSTGTLSFHRLL